MILASCTKIGAFIRLGQSFFENHDSVVKAATKVYITYFILLGEFIEGEGYMFGVHDVQNSAMQEITISKDQFSIIAVVRQAWLSIEGFKLTALLIYLSIGVVSSMITYGIYLLTNNFLIDSSAITLRILQVILILYFQAVLFSGIARFSLAQLRQENLDWGKDFFAFVFRSKFGKYFLVNLIQMVIICIPGTVFIGVLFFNSALLNTIFLVISILATLYLVISYSFVFFIITDNPDVGILIALKASRKMVGMNFLKILFLFLMLVIGYLILMLVVYFLTSTVLMAFYVGPNLFGVDMKVLIGVALGTSLPLLIINLWAIPFFWLLHGQIYLKIRPQ